MILRNQSYQTDRLSDSGECLSLAYHESVEVLFLFGTSRMDTILAGNTNTIQMDSPVPSVDQSSTMMSSLQIPVVDDLMKQQRELDERQRLKAQLTMQYHEYENERQAVSELQKQLHELKTECHELYDEWLLRRRQNQDRILDIIGHCNETNSINEVTSNEASDIKNSLLQHRINKCQIIEAKLKEDISQQRTIQAQQVQDLMSHQEQFMKQVREEEEERQDSDRSVREMRNEILLLTEEYERLTRHVRSQEKQINNVNSRADRHLVRLAKSMLN